MQAFMLLFLIGSLAVLGLNQSISKRFEKWPQVMMCNLQDFEARNKDSKISPVPEYPVKPKTEVAEKLREQVKKLKALIHVVILNNYGIKWEHEMLRQDILNLHQLVTELDSYNTENFYVLAFVEYLFDFVVNAAGLLEFHSQEVGIVQSLIRNLIHINAEIFDLIDEKGLPDVSIKKNSQAVSFLSETLSSWDYQRRNLQGISLISKFVLESQFRQAEEVLALLQSCVPQDKEIGALQYPSTDHKVLPAGKVS